MEELFEDKLNDSMICGRFMKRLCSCNQFEK
jgi:hypothetical protein